jgi:hypothetical protein
MVTIKLSISDMKNYFILLLGIFFTSVAMPTDSFDDLYQQGLIAQERMKSDNSSTWDTALDYYLQASALRPDRAEPLVAIARYYIAHEQLELAFMFARRACELAVPDCNMIELCAYDYFRYEALSACASSVREWKLGLWATQQALKARSKVERLHERLCYYHEQLTLEAGRAIMVKESNSL